MSDETLDCSDIDQIGRPIQPARLKEPLANNDIRRWVQAMHYPNGLHYDDEYAAEGRFGRIVAPQSFAVATDDGHGSAPSYMSAAFPNRIWFLAETNGGSTVPASSRAI